MNSYIISQLLHQKCSLKDADLQMDSLCLSPSFFLPSVSLHLHPARLWTKHMQKWKDSHSAPGWKTDSSLQLSKSSACVIC